MAYYIDSLPFMPYPEDTNPMDMSYQQKNYQNSFNLGEPVDLDQFDLSDMGYADKNALLSYNKDPTAPVTANMADLSYGQKSGLSNFNEGLLALKPEPEQPKGIFGDWGAGSQWNGLLDMPKNDFSYQSQGFNYKPQPFNYEPQSFSYTPQPFNYNPKKFGGV